MSLFQFPFEFSAVFHASARSWHIYINCFTNTAHDNSCTTTVRTTKLWFQICVIIQHNVSMYQFTEQFLVVFTFTKTSELSRWCDSTVVLLTSCLIIIWRKSPGGCSMRLIWMSGNVWFEDQSWEKQMHGHMYQLKMDPVLVRCFQLVWLWYYQICLSPGWALLSSGPTGRVKEARGEIMSDHHGPTTAQRPPCRWANTATNGRAGWTISRWMEAN